MKYILDYTKKKSRKFFEDICSIPHVSYNEKALSDFIVKFAEERGLWHMQDEIWNVIIKKPASPGYEDHEPVMIQGHIDMVGVKLAESNHNFDTDPLEIYVEDGFIRAKGTTLGADCGHGISYMLGILDDNNLKHPPIEALFTVQEEVGIGGPKHLDYSMLSAKRMIFTDSMEEGRPELSTTAVVGGDFTKKVIEKPDGRMGYIIRVGGLKGGHGAVNINEGRGNAISIAARTLLSLMDKGTVRINHLSGGDLKNNIPKTAEMIITSDLSSTEVEETIAELHKTLRFEYREHDPEVFLEMEEAGYVTESLTPETSKTIAEWLTLIPTGTSQTSLEDPSFPWTSSNLGTLRTETGKVIVGYQYRSNMKSHIDMMMKRMDILAELYDASWEEQFGYPGYVVQPGTPMYNAYDEVYRSLTGKGLVDKHIHAGTDVGTIIEGMGGNMDVVGIGPNTYKFHTPYEEMELASYDRAYQCIVGVLERL